MSGKLLIVPTPIGHLDDLTYRARQALESADRIACEDTRRTGQLLAHLRISSRMISLHEHNERQRVPALLDEIEAGTVVALVSDAGTPLVSDPGYVLVREAIARGLTVESLPGPSAVLTALAGSGLPPHPFTFAGFPPPKSGKRKRFLTELAAFGHTVVLFESPHRILATLADAAEAFGDRPAALGRELTKIHEEYLRGSLTEIAAKLAARDAIRGEITLVIGK